MNRFYVKYNCVYNGNDIDKTKAEIRVETQADRKHNWNGDWLATCWIGDADKICAALNIYEAMLTKGK